MSNIKITPIESSNEQSEEDDEEYESEDESGESEESKEKASPFSQPKVGASQGS